MPGHEPTNLVDRLILHETRQLAIMNNGSLDAFISIGLWTQSKRVEHVV